MQRGIHNLGLVLPSDEKLTLVLLASITLEAVLFHAYALFTVFLPIFKCILEDMFCVMIVMLFLVKNSLVKKEM
jgi:hypothetical protein